MYKKQKTTKIHNPNSLLALCIEAAANDYRFDPNDLFSYHKDIDFRHLHAGALSNQDYGFSLTKHLPRWLKRTWSENVSTFMGKRRTNINKLFKELAAMIVSFDKVEEIDKVENALGYGVSPLPKLRKKYVRYAQQMVEIENLGAIVNKGDQLQKLLICIQRERALLKYCSRNPGQEFFAGAGEQAYYAGGDGPCVMDEKLVDIDDDPIMDEPVAVFESKRYGRVFEVTNVTTGKKTIFDRTSCSERAKQAIPDQNSSCIEGKASPTNAQIDDSDDDEGIALYGLICA